MKILYLVIIVFLSFDVCAQNDGRQYVDSLIKSLSSIQNDTIKARVYNSIFNELTAVNVDEAMKYARAGLAHVQKMKWPKGIAVFQNNLGRAHGEKGNYDSTMFYYRSAMAAHTKAKDKYNMAVTHNNLGTAAQNIRADYTRAAGHYFEVLRLAEELNDSTLLSLSYSNVARIYLMQKNYVKALEYDEKALKIREKIGTPVEIASTLQGLGKTYYSQGDIPKAKQYFNRALSLYTSSGNLAGLASVWSSLSLVYGDDYRRIVMARLKSKQLWDEVNPLHSEAISNLGNLGVAYLDIVRYDTNHTVKYGGVIPYHRSELLGKAEHYLNAAIKLANQTGDMDFKSFYTGVLAEVQEMSGSFKDAYYNFKLYKETEDSIYSQENKNKIAEFENQRAIEKKNSEIKIRELALDNQRKTLWGLAGGLLLISIIGLLLYRQNRQRKKTNDLLLNLNQELDQANKIKAKFFAILSHDLRAPMANLINFLHLQKNEPGLLSQDQIVRHQDKITLSAETLLENMESMLLWSKSQMEHFKPTLVKVNTSDLFAKLQKSFATIDRIQWVFPVKENLFLTTDENYLLTIMHNLTSNAVAALKNTPNASIKWLVQVADEGVLFSIQDNGPGMPLEIVNILSDSSVHLGGKTGFGLQIVKDMAKAIHCSIQIESSSEGTVIHLIIPN